MPHGSMREHYIKIGSYLTTFKNPNLTSTFDLVTVPTGYPNSNLETFFRLFVCFDRGEVGFFWMVAGNCCVWMVVWLGRDSNDQIYPVAWAVVEGDSIDSWE